MSFDLSKINDTTTISILEDSVLEPTESFMVNLAFSGGPVPRVILSPSTTTVVGHEGRDYERSWSLILYNVTLVDYAKLT